MSTEFNVEPGLYSDGTIQVKSSELSEPTRMSGIISPYHVAGVVVNLIQDGSNRSYSVYISGIAEPGSQVQLVDAIGTIIQVTSGNSVHGHFYFSLANRTSNIENVTIRMVRMVGSGSGDYPIGSITIPNTALPIGDLNAPYRFDFARRPYFEVVNYDDEVSFDGGLTWQPYAFDEYLGMRVPEGMYTYGTIRIRSPAIPNCIDRLQIALPAIISPCEPVVLRVRYRSNSNTTITGAVSVDMIVFYSVGSSDTWQSIASDSRGSIAITVGGNNPEGTPFHFRTAPINYSLGYAAPVITINSSAIASS